MFERLNTPIATFGSASVKPAVRPSGVTSRNGGSENPSNGISSLERLDEAEDPEELDLAAGRRRRRACPRIPPWNERWSNLNRTSCAPGSRLSVKSLQLGEHVDPHLVLRRAPLDRQHQAVLLQLEHCIIAVGTSRAGQDSSSGVHS